MEASENFEFHFFKDITKEAYVYFQGTNPFALFWSIDRILYLIYANELCSIISYDLNNDKRFNEIKKAHSNYISSFRHYLDGNNKRDLVLSISTENNNVKVWNIKNFECLCNIQNIYEKSYILSACFVNENNEIFIVTGNEPYKIFEEIKVFELNGNKHKEIYNYDDLTHYIDSYYDKNLSKNFIITGNASYPRSYDYSNNQLYHNYSDDNNKGQYYLVFYDKDDILKLIECNEDYYIRIWDFHSGKLISKIKLSNSAYCKAYSLCISNNNCLFVGTSGREIIIIDLKTQKIISHLKDKYEVVGIQIIEHPKYGECLVTKGLSGYQIKLWTKNKKNL